MSNTAANLAISRVKALLDPGSFVEIGKDVTARNTDFNLSDHETPRDGVVTGYGVVDGNLVYLYSQDASVLGGSMGEMHGRKISNIYDMAMKMGAPVVGLLDCSGVRIEEGIDALNSFGELYLKQSLASGCIPQISAVFGMCGGGMAVIPGLSDFTFMESAKAKLFINAPNTLDKQVSKDSDHASSSFQKETTGLIDATGTEEEIIEKIRQLICLIPSSNDDDASYEECLDELNRTCEGLESYLKDPSIVLRTISDSGQFFELKRDYAKDMVTGFIRLNGVTIGAIANRSAIYDEEGKETMVFEPVLSSKGAKKAAKFVSFCDAFNIPILTLTNVEGFLATLCSEKTMAKSVAKLTYEFAHATVPKVNIILDKAYGSAYTVMNSKALGADVVYAWPNAKIAAMESKSAARVLYGNEGLDVINEKAAQYEELQESASVSARRGYIDTIIEPKETRKYAIGAFEMLFTKREDRPSKKHGTV